MAISDDQYVLCCLLSKSRPVLTNRTPPLSLLPVEGCMAIFIAILFLLALPESPSNPTSLLLPKICVFTSRERKILQARVYQSDAEQRNAGHNLDLKRDVLGTILNWRVWSHLILAVAASSSTSALILYTPALIKSFNFESECCSRLDLVRCLACPSTYHPF